MNAALRLSRWDSLKLLLQGLYPGAYQTGDSDYVILRKLLTNFSVAQSVQGISAPGTLTLVETPVFESEMAPGDRMWYVLTYVTAEGETEARVDQAASLTTTFPLVSGAYSSGVKVVLPVPSDLRILQKNLYRAITDRNSYAFPTNNAEFREKASFDPSVTEYVDSESNGRWILDDYTTTAPVTNTAGSTVVGQPVTDVYSYQYGDLEHTLIRKILQRHTSTAATQYQYGTGDPPRDMVRKWLQYLGRNDSNLPQYAAVDSETQIWRKILQILVP